jgi:protein O-GlcNAcase/histone acetyltransferase
LLKYIYCSQVETVSQDEIEDRKPTISQELNGDDLLLLCDLFYLPYEHGGQGIQIMEEFQWLKSNSNVIAGATAKDKLKPEVKILYYWVNKSV